MSLVIKSPQFVEYINQALFLKRGLVVRVPSHLPGIIPAGFSTVPLQSVAGFHWASPSTTLDKSILTYGVDAFSIVSCFGLGVTIFPAPGREIY